MHELTPELAHQIARRAIEGIVRPYPCKPGHILNSSVDAVPPKERTPSFYGCFDWHSAVHAHWSLARLLQISPTERWASEARSTLRKSLSSENLQTEFAFRQAQPSFEIPYGVAWLLFLQAALHDDEESWPKSLHDLCALAGQQFSSWLAALPCPIRSGEHSQSAFAMAMVHDAAVNIGDTATADQVRQTALDFYEADTGAPTSFEPSAYDFLSPCLAEADLMTRAMTSDDFALWFDAFWGEAEFVPVHTSNRQDGKLTHWDGLNLSRAWMLARVAAHLPSASPKREPLEQSAAEHLSLGLEGLSSEHYAGSHWLGSFALYALTCVRWPT